MTAEYNKKWNTHSKSYNSESKEGNTNHPSLIISYYSEKEKEDDIHSFYHHQKDNKSRISK
jgi:hypothetical protein